MVDCWLLYPTCRVIALAWMYNLLKGLWQSFRRPPTFNIVILGLDGAGKTTLLNRLKLVHRTEEDDDHEEDEDVGATMPTIGMNCTAMNASCY